MSLTLPAVPAAAPPATPSAADLLGRFRAGSLPPAELTHARHVELGWLYLRELPLARALGALSADLAAYARRHGDPGKYHETVTWAYLLLIHERMRRDELAGERRDEAGAWEAFAHRWPELFARRPSLLESYYRTETLASDLARRTFLLPDRLQPV